MQILRYLPLAFAALAIAAPATSKSKAVTADTVVADISAIQAKTLILKQTVEPYQGGITSLGTALAVNSAADDVSKAIKQAIKDAKALAPLTDDEAIKIGLAVINLSPDVISTLDVFKNKKAAFDDPYRLSFIVRLTLEDQRKSTSELSAAIKDKVPAQFKDLATQVSQPLLDKFDEVIAVYKAK